MIDQIGYSFELKTPPQRIISVVPSQTELLYDLGLNDEVVGITKFCIHPESWFKTKERVGGTKSLKIDKIKELNPDFIIANKEENTQSEIEELQQLFPVYTSDIGTLQDSLRMISDIGDIVSKEIEADRLKDKIEDDFNRLSQLAILNKSVLYLIWQKPYMSVGRDTFIFDMLARCGYKSVIETKDRYPELSVEEIKELNPDYLFLSSEPFPFKEKHKSEFEELFQSSRIVLVDGEMFSWYGSRLTKAVDYFIELKEKLD